MPAYVVALMCRGTTFDYIIEEAFRRDKEGLTRPFKKIEAAEKCPVKWSCISQRVRNRNAVITLI